MGQGVGSTGIKIQPNYRQRGIFGPEVSISYGEIHSQYFIHFIPVNYPEI